MELEISVKPATQTQDNERNINTKCDEGTMAATHEMHNKSHSKQMLYLQLVKSKFNKKYTEGTIQTCSLIQVYLQNIAQKKKFSVDFIFCAVKEVKSL